MSLHHESSLIINEDSLIEDDPHCNKNVQGNESLPVFRITSKWSSTKYSRRERLRRKREMDDSTQPLITSYYQLLDAVEARVEHILKTNPKICAFIAEYENVCKSNTDYATCEKSTNETGTNSLLKTLMEVAIKNSMQSSNRNRYTDVIKQFAIYLYYIGGRLLYETLEANLKNALPAISTLNRYVDQNKNKIQEGEFDYDGLKLFLENRKLPKYVWISEDATRITGKIEYDSTTNKVIGFVMPLKDGFPQMESYVALSAQAIEGYFQNNKKSEYAYVIMAQSLSEVAPSYCLAIYGTDNKFRYTDVTSRWNTMTRQLDERGIIVLGYSSDGDTRLLKSMRYLSSLPPELQISQWEWYQMNSDLNVVQSYIQDTVHIATKLRVRILKAGKPLIMGRYTANPDHLFLLIHRFPKNDHFLAESDLNNEVKMNFRSAEKICSEAVLNLLKKLSEETSEETDATVQYLRIMQYATSSFLDQALTVEVRIYRMWYCVFFLRIWRQWILNTASLKLSDNFLTSNAYLCIEQNAHSIIKIIRLFHKHDLDFNMFIPHLFSSQVCEQIFRATRSMTSTFSTVVNFSLKNIMERLDRIKVINNLMNDLHGTLIFPREKRQPKVPNFSKCNDSEFVRALNFSDTDIERIVHQALSDSILAAENLGIEVFGKAYNQLNIPLKVDEKFTQDELQQYSEESKMDEAISSVNQNEDSLCLVHENVINTVFSDNINNDENVNDDFDISADMEVEIPEERSTASSSSSTPYVEVITGGKREKLKKSTFCWLLEKGKVRISSDRLSRFHTSKKPRENPNWTKHQKYYYPQTKNLQTK
ncbi:uncharacterized protein LOC116179261 [Photinus pyralis]|uniref:uncharacterized protein LOC116179261 n=2 Tax=Photinus pyralis TaxID=7054 RepID=UPI001266FE7D|nr:uncharacterized protein LOC116179261 [Photinus pyralis]